MTELRKRLNEEHELCLKFCVPPCPVCGKIIRDSDKAVQCYKSCRRWFHKNCINLRFSLYMKYEDKIKLRWACETDECKHRGNESDQSEDEWKSVSGVELLIPTRDKGVVMPARDCYALGLQTEDKIKIEDSKEELTQGDSQLWNTKNEESNEVKFEPMKEKSTVLQKSRKDIQMFERLSLEKSRRELNQHIDKIKKYDDVGSRKKDLELMVGAKNELYIPQKVKEIMLAKHDKELKQYRRANKAIAMDSNKDHRSKSKGKLDLKSKSDMSYIGARSISRGNYVKYLKKNDSFYTE